MISIASGRVIAGRMVVSRRASIDVPAPGGPSTRTLWAERLHHLQSHQSLWRCRSSAVNLLATPEHGHGPSEPVTDRGRVGYHMTNPPLMLIDCPVM